MATEIVNHDEAKELAQMKAETSNLARAYLDAEERYATLLERWKEEQAKRIELEGRLKHLGRLTRRLTRLRGVLDQFNGDLLDDGHAFEAMCTILNELPNAKG